MNTIATGLYVAIDGYTLKVSAYGTLEYVNTILTFNEDIL